MKLPILAYGHPLLRTACREITASFPRLDALICNMWDTMKAANGCGLAAPQVGQDIRLFIVDSKTTFDHLAPDERDGYFAPGDEGIAETFINARITHRSEETWEDPEGCLSIPGITQAVRRSWAITINYCNTNFEKQTKTFSGATARMIQHEYDHTEGIFYLDHLSPLKRKLLDAKLKRIAKGNVAVNYPMKFP